MSVLNISFLFMVFCYIFTTMLNFFSPIKVVESLIIILISLLSGIFCFKKLNVKMFDFLNVELSYKRGSKILFIFIPIMVIWFFMSILMPTVDTDAHVYHLPTAILMNHSKWYPGIGKLSIYSALPNGTSTLASIFTAFNIPGFENFPNIAIWFLFGCVIYLYLKKHNIKESIKLLTVAMFLLCPDIFWRSYNIGTDLPLACFMVFGFMTLKENKVKDTILFFTMSSIFKPQGLIAVGLTTCFAIFFRGIRILFDIKILLSALILFVLFMRQFIATGNPVFPVLSCSFTHWGIPPQVQSTFVDGVLKSYVRRDYTIQGLLDFVVAFFINPSKYCSSFWFSPVFVIWCVFFVYMSLKKQNTLKTNPESLFLYFLMLVLTLIWFYFSPLFRFNIAVFVFLTLRFCVNLFSNNAKRISNLLSKVGIFVLFLTTSMFLFNVGWKHFRKYIIPFLVKGKPVLPYEETIFLKLKTKEGYLYTKSLSTFVGRNTPPWVSHNSVGDEEEIIRTFYRYNRQFKR